tara:strand:+ start:1114 stop:1683 length:570 start_codon:yes stop_codon:yes gene_type:complete
MNFNFLHNKNIQLSIIGILFILWFFFLGKKCPCGYKNISKRKGCYRFEIFGVQTNHLYFFAFLGYFFSDYFYIIQSAGILWELFEMYLDYNEKIAFSIGGCLAKPDYKLSNKWYYNYLITEGKEKYLNPIDRLFGIKNSKKHGWHGSIAEIFVNFIGFGIGSYVHKKFNMYEYSSTIFIFIIILLELLF